MSVVTKDFDFDVIPTSTNEAFPEAYTLFTLQFVNAMIIFLLSLSVIYVKRTGRTDMALYVDRYMMGATIA